MSPVCSTRPAGVLMATASASGMEWLTAEVLAVELAVLGPLALAHLAQVRRQPVLRGSCGCARTLPIVGSKFTSRWSPQVQEHRLRRNLREVREGQRNQARRVNCEYFAVNHSIPDALAVADPHPAGLVLAHR